MIFSLISSSLSETLAFYADPLIFYFFSSTSVFIVYFWGNFINFPFQTFLEFLIAIYFQFLEAIFCSYSVVPSSYSMETVSSFLCLEILMTFFQDFLLLGAMSLSSLNSSLCLFCPILCARNSSQSPKKCA